MPAMASPFPHQTYQSTPPTSPHHLVRPARYPAVESDEFYQRMQQVGDVLRAGGVGAIYLAHGTFAGNDPSGLIGELGRLFPSASACMRRIIKQMIDAAAADVGNY